MNGVDRPLSSEESGALRQGYFEWLDSELSLFAEYHNHKETMAWTATAAYLSVVILAYSAADWPLHLASRLVFSLLIGAVGCVTYIFVSMQFEMRWVAADLCTALRRVKGKLLDPETEWTSLHRNVPPAELKTTEEKSQWPAFVADEVRVCATQRQGLAEIGRMILHGKLTEINPRRRSELASYFAIAAVTLIGVAAVYSDRPDADIGARLAAVEEALRRLEGRLP